MTDNSFNPRNIPVRKATRQELKRMADNGMLEDYANYHIFLRLPFGRLVRHGNHQTYECAEAIIMLPNYGLINAEMETAMRQALCYGWQHCQRLGGELSEPRDDEGMRDLLRGADIATRLALTMGYTLGQEKFRRGDECPDHNLIGKY